MTCNLNPDCRVINDDRRMVSLAEKQSKYQAKAIEQIESTLQQLQSSLSGCKVHARIALTRVQSPDVRSTAYTKLDHTMRRLGGNWKRGKLPEESIEDDSRKEWK